MSASNRHRARQRTMAVSAVVTAVALLLIVLIGCDSGSKPADENAKKSSDTAELFTIPPEQMAHVQVLTVQTTTLARTLRLTGAVAYNSFNTTPVITPVSGPVSRIAVVPGQKVKKGEPMLYVASPDYSQLRTNYLKARDAYALAQKAYARAHDLYEHKAIAEQNVEDRKSVV